MSLRVGNTFCKGKRFVFNTKPLHCCEACVFGEKWGRHTCGKREPAEIIERGKPSQLGAIYSTPEFRRDWAALAEHSVGVIESQTKGNAR